MQDTKALKLGRILIGGLRKHLPLVASSKTATKSESPAKMWKEVHFHIDMHMYFIRIRMGIIILLEMQFPKETSANSSLPTPTCQNSQSSDTNWAIQCATPTL